MVTYTFDVLASLLDLVEPWSAILRHHVSRLWHGIHGIARLMGSEKLMIGLACGKWQPVPSAAALGALADVVERSKDPKVLSAAASLLQHACLLQPLLRSRLLELATCVERLRSVDPGVTGYALRTHLHFQGLLSGRLAFEDVDSDPDDLRRLWRKHVEAYRGKEALDLVRLVRVLRELQKASADILFDQEGLSMDEVHERIIGMIAVDLVAVRVWAYRNLSQQDAWELIDEIARM